MIRFYLAYQWVFTKHKISKYLDLKEPVKPMLETQSLLQKNDYIKELEEVAKQITFLELEKNRARMTM